jgi:hypothetical protein
MKKYKREKEINKGIEVGFHDLNEANMKMTRN